MTEASAPWDRSEMFWAKVEKGESCWDWTAYKKHDGYGQFWDGSRLQLAHRVAYEREVGPILDGLELDHTCHNRGCVNPEHLRQVTHKANIENRNGAQSNSKSGVRGVCWDKRRDLWHARVGNYRKMVHVGYFSDLEAARIAVEAKRSEIFTANNNETSN